MSGELKTDESLVGSSAGRIVAILLVIAAGVLRWQASLGDFWLDEIWTWFLVQQQVRTDWDVFSNIKHDNNHLLNSWVIFRMGPDQPFTLYRLPAVLAGTGAVVLAGWQARARGTVEALLALLLTGWSFILVHYSSEARGYAYLLFFTMLAYTAQARFDRTLSWQSALTFSLACVGGFLAQFAFAFPYVAFAVWQFWSLCSDWSTRRFWRTAAVHVPTMALLGMLYVVNRFDVGGADVIPTLDVIRMTLSLALGGPEEGTGSWMAAGVAALLLLGGLVWLWRTERREAVFFATALLGAPVLVVLVTGYGHLLPRHLLIPMLLLQLLMARLLASLFQRGRAGQTVVVVLLVASLAVNLFPLTRLLEFGRGGYVEALQFMSSEARLPVLTIGSDHDFRNKMLIDFYREQSLKPGDHPRMRFPVYIPQPQFTRMRPEWYIVHSQSRDFNPPATLGPHGEYRLRKKYPYSTLSGWHWAVYQTETPTLSP